jgi:hypothetical protein
MSTTTTNVDHQRQAHERAARYSKHPRHDRDVRRNHDTRSCYPVTAGDHLRTCEDGRPHVLGVKRPPPAWEKSESVFERSVRSR